MPKRDADLLIEDIQTALARIENYTTGLDRETFLQDQKTIDAVVRNWRSSKKPFAGSRQSSKIGKARCRGRRLLECGTGSCMTISVSTWRSYGMCFKRLCQNSSANSPAFLREKHRGDVIANLSYLLTLLGVGIISLLAERRANPNAKYP
jgi:hypothetical protein